MSDDSKAIVVLTREDIDIAIHAIEEASIGMDDERFQEDYGELYRKLHAIDRPDQDNDHQVK